MSAATKAIHAGCRQLGIDEDGRRAIYLRVVGKDSQSTMTEEEKERVVAELRSLGFERRDARRPDGRLKLSGKYAPKLQALWIAGWNLDVVRNRDDAALEAFVRGRTGLEAVRFCHDSNDARKAIEALKAMLARAGVDWTIDNERAAYTQTDGYRIARAQAHLLEIHYSDFWSTVWGIAGVAGNTFDLPRPQWIAVMNDLGKRVRAAKKAGA